MQKKKKKKEKKEDEFAQVHYLDELVDMTTHNLVGRCSRKYLHLLNSKGLLCLRQCDPSVVLDTGRMRVSFILPFVTCTLPLPEGSDLFNRGSQGGCPHRLNARGGWIDEDPLLHYVHSLGPKTGKGLILLSPHSCIHPLVELRRHPYKRKILVKNTC